MTTFEFHRRAVQCRELLQSLGGDDAYLISGSAVRMQDGYAATIGLLEFGQSAAGIQSQDLVQIEKIGLARQVFPL